MPPQFDHQPGGAQVLDVETAVKDGILSTGGGYNNINHVDLNFRLQNSEESFKNNNDEGDNFQPVVVFDLRKMIEEVESAGEEVPGVFICPISLEPMIDPVTLCTGQTYDRRNILKWLSLGRSTCPTTMQELWDPTLTPNATLQHLISAWFSRRFSALRKRSVDVHGRAQSLLSSLKCSKGQSRLSTLRELRRLLSSQPSISKPLAGAGAGKFLVSLLGPFTSHALGSEAAAVLAAVCPLDSESIRCLMEPARVSLLVDLLNDGSIETKLCCVQLIESMISATAGDTNFRPESFSSLSLFAALLRLAKDKKYLTHGAAAGLDLLRKLCVYEQVRPVAISVGAVPQIVELVHSVSAPECIESALHVLDDLSGLPEGRAALRECPQTIPNMVRLLMRVSEVCTQRALSVLWTVCKIAPDECASIAVEAGLAAKLLLVIQSGCSPAVKQKAVELLKLCSLNYTATLFISKCKLTRTIQ